MSNCEAFVLVHGAWHNHNTWDALAPLLEASGQTVHHMSTSHSPFYSDPSELAGILTAIARSSPPRTP